jgi:hypothetical protein
MARDIISRLHFLQRIEKQALGHGQRKLRPRAIDVSGAFFGANPAHFCWQSKFQLRWSS